MNRKDRGDIFDPTVPPSAIPALVGEEMLRCVSLLAARASAEHWTDKLVPMPEALYDRIGQTYISTRSPDPRVATAIESVLGDAETIVNVGAGTGAYEPVDRPVIAVEPSWQMIQQRSPGESRVVQAVAESLPFTSGAFDVALAVLTMHHWANWRLGIAEMKRVARRVVVFAFDVSALDSFWLTETYLPEIIEFDRGRSPSIAEITGELGDCSAGHVPIPHDCVDGFLAAFWRRPEAYLDPGVGRAFLALRFWTRMRLLEPSRGLKSISSPVHGTSASGISGHSNVSTWATAFWRRSEPNDMIRWRAAQPTLEPTPVADDIVNVWASLASCGVRPHATVRALDEEGWRRSG